MNAFVTMLTHFSQRYPKIPLLSADNSGGKGGMCLAFDLMEINTSQFPLVHHLLPALPCLWKDDDESEDTEMEETNTTNTTNNGKQEKETNKGQKKKEQSTEQQKPSKKQKVEEKK